MVQIASIKEANRRELVRSSDMTNHGCPPQVSGILEKVVSAIKEPVNLLLNILNASVVLQPAIDADLHLFNFFLFKICFSATLPLIQSFKIFG